jgi:hypothetical protein
MKALDHIFLDAAEKLKESVRQNQTLDTAQVKVIGLDEIRNAAGADWPQIADRVRSNSMMFLEGCLDERDIILPAGDGFLIVFAVKPDRDPAREAEMVRDALNGFYLGQEDLTSLRAHVEHKAVESASMAALCGAAPAALQAKSKPEVTPKPEAKAETVFLPVWVVPQEAVTGYWLVPLSAANGKPWLGYDDVWLKTGAHHPQDFLARDLSILERAIAETERCMTNGQRCLVGYTVHSSTLSNRARRQIYLRALQSVPELMRPYFVARIAEIERGTPSMTIAEWVHQLRPVSLRVNLELHETERTIRGLEGSGAFSASCVLSAAQFTPAGRARYAQLIRTWQPELKRQGLKFRLDNVLDHELLTLAAASGVDLLSGEAMWPSTKHPAGVKPFSRGQFSNALAHIALSAPQENCVHV